MTTVSTKLQLVGPKAGKRVSNGASSSATTAKQERLSFSGTYRECMESIIYPFEKNLKKTSFLKEEVQKLILSHKKAIAGVIAETIKDKPEDQAKLYSYSLYIDWHGLRARSLGF